MNLYRVSIKLRGERKHLIGNFLADTGFGSLHLAADHFKLSPLVAMARIMVTTIAEDVEGVGE